MGVASAALIALSMPALAADAAKSNAPAAIVTAPKMVTLGTKVLPLPPPKPGCYRHHPPNGATRSAAEWEAVPCASKNVMTHLAHPQFKGDLLASGSPAIGNAQLHFNMVLFGSETDSRLQNGANNFSLQINPNSFVGADGQQYAVQFTHESGGGIDPQLGLQPSVVCIWNINVSTQNYGEGGNSSCVTVDRTRGPQTGDQANMIGIATPGSGGAPAVLTLLAVLPWTTGGNVEQHPDAWSVQTQDVNGLTSHWNWVAGALLGFGAGSQAKFSASCMTTQMDLNALPRGNQVTYSNIPGLTGYTAENTNLQTLNTPKPICLPYGNNQEQCQTTFYGVSPDGVSNGKLYQAPTNACYPQYDLPPPAPCPKCGGSGNYPTVHNQCPRGMTWDSASSSCVHTLTNDKAQQP